MVYSSRYSLYLSVSVSSFSTRVISVPTSGFSASVRVYPSTPEDDHCQASSLPSARETTVTLLATMKAE